MVGTICDKSIISLRMPQMSLFFSTLTFSFEDFGTTSTVSIIRISQIGSSSKMEEADEYDGEVQQVLHFDDFISYHDASAILNFWRKYTSEKLAIFRCSNSHLFGFDHRLLLIVAVK